MVQKGSNMKKQKFIIMVRKGIDMKKHRFIVMVDDNFHFTDTSERYKAGEYDTYDGAVTKCKAIVDDFLESAIEPNMTSEQLYNSYTMYGDDPYIIGFSDNKFSAWEYANERSRRLIR